MNFFKSAITKQPELTRRIFNGGFEQMGSIKRTPDTRTTAQLLENIEYFASKNPEVAKFKDQLKSINPKHLGLVSDICELANHSELLPNTINMKKETSSGKSLLQFLMEKIPVASKENPEVLELSQAIIDNIDTRASKYALCEITPLYECKEAAPHMKATIPFIGEIANTTLKGGFLMDYTKERNFVNCLKSFISPNVQLEKMGLLSNIIKFADKAKTDCSIYAFPFLTNKTPLSKIYQNLDTFKQLDEHLAGKSVNLTDFLEKNTNLV